MVHVVDRLRFEIGCADEQAAFDIRANVAPTLQSVALATIDALCSRYVADDDILEIDTIEIDLGELSANGIERNFAAEFEARFESELRKRLAVRAPRQPAERLADRRFELFRYVMMHGVLPWWALSAEVDLDQLTHDMQRERPAELRAFVHAHASDDGFWQRVAWQLGASAQAVLIGAYAPLARAEERLQTVLGQALQRGAEEHLEPKRREALLVYAREALVRHGAALTGAADIDTLMARIVAEVLQANAPPEQREAVAGLKGIDHARESVAAAAPTVTASVVPTAAAVPRPPQAPEGAAGEDARYVVRHAGLVLLAPFFARLFGGCELLDEGRWRSKEAQYTGVHLLRYLCTGASRSPEHDLVLEKLCCGMPIEEPVPRAIVLRDEFVAEAQALLAAVLEHWQALKRTSVDGLRETFLRREGLVLKLERDWLLKVERKTVDVLIDSIPWGYSTLAMPWNPYVIHVEW